MADWPDYERYARPRDYNHDEEAADDTQRYHTQPLQQLQQLHQAQLQQLQQARLHRTPLQYRDTPPPTPQKDYPIRHDMTDRLQASPSRMSRMSRLSRLSRGSRLSLGSTQTTDCTAIECFLRVASAILSSAIIAASATLYVLLDTDKRETTVDRLNWVIGVPLGATALVWQLARLGLLAATFDDSYKSTALLAADITVESTLAVGGVICAVLAGFQAARHAGQREGGCDVALAVLIGLLAVVSFGVLAATFVGENQRRAAMPEEPQKEKKQKEKNQKQKKERRRFRHSSNSSVIEIIRR